MERDSVAVPKGRMLLKSPGAWSQSAQAFMQKLAQPSTRLCDLQRVSCTEAKLLRSGTANQAQDPFVDNAALVKARRLVDAGRNTTYRWYRRLEKKNHH